MQTLTESVLKLNPPGGIFDGTVIRNLFPGHSEGARKALVHRAVHTGEVLRLKPGLHCLADDLGRSHPHPFVVAALLHYPSHISLESALSHHGLIPEAVYQVTSVTSGRSRSYTTPLGVFSYRTVPASPPRAGVVMVQMGDARWAFIATSLRAIADLVYLRKKVTWNSDGSRFLTESMRIEQDDLRDIPVDEFDEIMRSIRDRRTRKYLSGLRQEVGR